MRRKAAIATLAFLVLGALFILTGEKGPGVVCILMAVFSAIAGLESGGFGYSNDAQQQKEKICS